MSKFVGIDGVAAALSHVFWSFNFLFIEYFLYFVLFFYFTLDVIGL